MRRREFITLLGGTAAAWPLAARAQQPAMPVVGFLGIVPVITWASRVAALRAGLRELGYIEGKNVGIEFRWAETPVQLPELAAELAKAEVAVIIAGGNALARAGKSATSKIPILFVIADDPVRLGFVESFKRPGGNMTGLSMISGTLGAKRMELLRELVPKATAIAMLINPNNPAEDNVRDEQAAARAIGQRILVAEASTVREIEIAFEGIARQGADAVLVNADSFFTSQRDQLVALAARHRLPTVYAWREFVGTGGLMSYGTSLTGGYHQLGLYAARILKGEKAADLPVMQPTKFELVINLKTAKALGLEIPAMLLARADEVIE